MKAVLTMDIPSADFDFASIFDGVPPHDFKRAFSCAISFAGITEAEAVGSFGRLNIIRRRWAVWTALKFGRGMSYPNIGRRFGKDHTTILYGVRQFRAIIEANRAEAIRA